MLRDITFIQLGQLIVALMGGRLRAHRSPGGDVAGEPVSSPHLFALRIALRVRHIVAGMGFRVTMAKEGKVTNGCRLGLRERNSPGPQSRGDAGAARDCVRSHELTAGARRARRPHCPRRVRRVPPPLARSRRAASRDRRQVDMLFFDLTRILYITAVAGCVVRTLSGKT